MFKFKKKYDISSLNLPKHVGIIMDGNGRWAKKRGLVRSMGHREGAKTFRKIARYCSNIGIKYLTVYAFSTENWKRPTDEVNYLMKLFERYLKEALEDFKEENNRVLFLGDKSGFSENLQNLIKEVEESSKYCTGMTLNIAMNYGGRDEIVKACKSIALKVKNSELSLDNIDEEVLSNEMYTKGQDDPDLIIRPSGEYRLSNFLTWQSAYSELVFMDILWPDFTEKDLDRAILEYNSRNRRFGGV